MMNNIPVYPVHKLNANITRYLQNIVSADILTAVTSGLKNEVEFFDDGGHITDVAKIIQNQLTGQAEVWLSSAYCQYFWLICDVVIKVTDRVTTDTVIAECHQTVQQYLDEARLIASTPIEDLLAKAKAGKWPLTQKEVERYRDYMKMVPSLYVPDFWDRVDTEFRLAMSLVFPGVAIDYDAINAINIDEDYTVLNNSLCCFGIAFIMLHELSHFNLKHLGREEQEGDEDSADQAAFWSVFNDISDEKRFSANASMLCVFISFMIMSPSLEEDGVHPRHDKRLFAIYGNINDESPKYTQLVVRLLELWARIYNIEGYPMNLPDTEESVEKIKRFLDNRQEELYGK